MGERSGPAAHDFAAAPSHASPAPGGDRGPANLPGREGLLARARQRLLDSGGSHLLVVEGERGAGRSTFLHALAAAARAERRGVAFLVCGPEDGGRPLLLALRLVKALEQHRQASVGTRRTGSVAAEALAAVERGDAAAVVQALVPALAQSAPVTLVVDDAHHADPQSLDLLGGVDLERVAPDVRLVVSAVRHSGRGAHGPGDGVGRLAERRGAHRTVLPRLAPAEVAALVDRRLQAVADPELVRQTHHWSAGVPAAVNVLLAAWSRDGAFRTIDGRVLLRAGTPPPVLPDEDRFVAALRALGEPSRTVAAALSVLWPLGRAAEEHAAGATGLSAARVAEGLRTLTAAGIVVELPGPADEPPRGWAFTLPLLEHTVRRRLGPLERNRLSVAAVAAVRRAADDRRPGAREAAGKLLAEADADVYLPDRLTEVDSCPDRRRDITELVAAAERLHPDPDRRGMLRWLRTAVRFAEAPELREDLTRRYVGMAYTAGEYEAVRPAATSVLRDPAGFDPVALQETAAMLVGSVAAAGDRMWLDRLSSGHWWQTLELPAAVEVTGRALALCGQGRWQQALALLTDRRWEADDGGATRELPALFRAVAEYVCGEPERFLQSLTLPDVGGLSPHGRRAATVMQVHHLLGAGELTEAETVLAHRGLAQWPLPPYTLFLRRHLEGRWDEALAVARRLLVTGQAGPPAPGHHLLPGRTAGILLARGRTRSAQRLLEAARGQVTGPAESLLDRAEAELTATLGDLFGAEQTLRRGLKTAEAGGYVYGTDELWAGLAELCLATDRAPAAAECVRMLERTAGQQPGSRARLLYLRVAARLPGQEATAARGLLREAVNLARFRNQPFETAVTLLTAAPAVEEPAPLLYEAYDLFGDVGAALWRFRTRAAIRESGNPVPGRRQATVENEQLLAVLVAEGLPNRRISGVLGISEDAVANRLTRLFARAGVRSRAEVVAAVRTGHLLGALEE
ncbi:AAA family ATPase [Streptomyces sp. NPDC059740]|uniref:ATP-binding protein n=1 Tax=Streptomyces sp. NPDC059740 TaxID=3346926 RepID=UPI0036699237